MSEEYTAKTGWVNPASIDKLAPALVKAQGQIEGATKGKKNDHFRSKYADLGAVWDACRDALQANELAVVQLPCEAPGGHVGLITTIVHSSGQTMSARYHMPLKDPTNPQAAGSALTYARRYALSAAIGICPVDDDGNQAASVTGVPKASKPPEVDNVALADDFRKRFSAAKNAEQQKALFMEARNSPLQEPQKTALLTELSKVLKGK